VPGQNEFVQLQEEITREVTSDAPHIAEMVFGDAKDHPDMVGLANASLDQVYRQAFLKEDRTFLQSEARRDPEQFLKIADRIGVKMPPPTLPGMAELPQPGAFAKAATALPPAPPMAPSMPPVAAPMSAVPPVPSLLPSPPPAPLAPSAPVILGPNGQPLPPSGLA
jgi:hypothetical protein